MVVSPTKKKNAPFMGQHAWTQPKHWAMHHAWIVDIIRLIPCWLLCLCHACRFVPLPPALTEPAVDESAGISGVGGADSGEGESEGGAGAETSRRITVYWWGAADIYAPLSRRLHASAVGQPHRIPRHYPHAPPCCMPRDLSAPPTSVMLLTLTVWRRA
jgi:hypothetical protein